MTLDKIKTIVSDKRLNLAQKRGAKETLETQIKSLKETIDENSKLIAKDKEAHLLTLGFISTRRDSALESFQEAGSYGLRAIYGDDYSVHFLTNGEKKNSAAFKMEIGIESQFKKEKFITGLAGERGGGVMENTALNFRLVALEMLGYQGPVLLDETCKSISSDDKVEKTATLIKEYGDSSGRQTFFITHKPEPFLEHADRIIKVEMKHGISSTKTIQYDEY